MKTLRRFVLGTTLASALLLARPAAPAQAQDTQDNQNPPANLKQLSLEQLGDVEVTTVSKEPEKVQQTPAAVYVLTQEDIEWQHPFAF